MVAVVANLKSAGVHKLLKELCKHKLVTYERGPKCKKKISHWILKYSKILFIR